MPATLTTLLRDLGQQSIDGASRPRQEIIAAMAWDYLIAGEVTFPNGSKLTATSREWISALKWLMAQIDGKPSRETRSAPAREAEPYPSHPVASSDYGDFAFDSDDFRPVPTSPSAGTPDDFDEAARNDVFHPRFPAYSQREQELVDVVAAYYARPTVVGLQPKLPASLPRHRIDSSGRIILIDRDGDDPDRVPDFRSSSDPDRHPTRDG